jgi:hypothetical protein
MSCELSSLLVRDSRANTKAYSTYLLLFCMDEPCRSICVI